VSIFTPDYRYRYRNSKVDFTGEVVEFLQSVRSIQDALREFIEATAEKDWIRTRDDAQELAGRFGELAQRLSPYLVEKRAKKELREVVAIGKVLPFAAVASGEANFRRLLSKLESAALQCQKCGGNMVLRESQHGYFWGCSAFPTCFGKRCLSAEEFKCLFN